MTTPTALASLLTALLVACGESHVPQTAQPAAPSGATEPRVSDHVDAPSGQPQPGLPVEEVADRFVEAVSPSFGATRRGVDEPYPLSPDGPLARQVEAWSFVEHEVAPSSSGVRLRFSLRIFEFGSIDEASDALAGLAATAHGSMLLKSPLLAVQTGPDVVRLDGACSFSRAPWVEVQDALMEALPPGDVPAGALEIVCGGTVVRTPGSGPPGGGRQHPADGGVRE